MILINHLFFEKKAGFIVLMKPADRIACVVFNQLTI